MVRSDRICVSQIRLQTADLLVVLVLNKNNQIITSLVFQSFASTRQKIRGRWGSECHKQGGDITCTKFGSNFKFTRESGVFMTTCTGYELYYTCSVHKYKVLKLLNELENRLSIWTNSKKLNIQQTVRK